MSRVHCWQIVNEATARTTALSPHVQTASQARLTAHTRDHHTLAHQPSPCACAVLLLLLLRCSDRHERSGGHADGTHTDGCEQREHCASDTRAVGLLVTPSCMCHGAGVDASGAVLSAVQPPVAGCIAPRAHHPSPHHGRRLRARSGGLGRAWGARERQYVKSSKRDPPTAAPRLYMYVNVCLLAS